MRKLRTFQRGSNSSSVERVQGRCMYLSEVKQYCLNATPQVERAKELGSMSASAAESTEDRQHGVRP